MSNEDLIRRVADELEIRNAIVKLAFLTDRYNDLDAYAETFAEDLHWELRPGKAGSTPLVVKGRAAMRAQSVERRKAGSGPGSHSHHVISMTTVTVNGDTADAESLMTFYRNTDSKPEVASMGLYRDKFVRTPQGWKIGSRLILTE